MASADFSTLAIMLSLTFGSVACFLVKCGFVWLQRRYEAMMPANVDQTTARAAYLKLRLRADGRAARIRLIAAAHEALLEQEAMKQRA